MKSLYQYALILIIVPSFLLGSCDRCEKGSGNVIRIPRSVPSFNQVKLPGSFNLYIRQDSVQKVEIVADDNIAPFLETEVEGSTLVLKYERNKCTRRSTRSDIYISVPSLTKLTLDGSGLVQGENTFKGDGLSAVIKGSGNMTLAYEGESLTGVIEGSGNLNLSGNSNSASYSVNGSGNINASQVNAKAVIAAVSGSGNIELTAINTLNAMISGSGNINYFGNPTVSKNVSGSGSVNKK